MNGAVVRWRGHWWRADLHDQSPQSITLDEVLSLAGPADPHGLLSQTDGVFAPVAAIVLQNLGGSLVAVGAEGPVRLGPDELTLLDSFQGPRSVSDLPMTETVRTALSRLITAGLLCPATEAPAPPVESMSAVLPQQFPAQPRRRGDAPSNRVPIYAIWQRAIGPMLSLGMLTAAARHHRNGALTEYFEIRPPEECSSFLDDIRTRPGPAVLLCSDYVFTIEENLRVARAALDLNPELLVVHGGPNSPRFSTEIETFFNLYDDVAHVLVRGEGERTLCELLDSLSCSALKLDPARLSAIDGISFRDPHSGEVVRTPDRERISDLDDLPSPYLTGEFDHLSPTDWAQPPFFETNRGCPYGCTFCDWGSATRSRVRRFDLDRVGAEFEWAAARGLAGAYLCDANFGIYERDVDVAERLAAARRRYGAPRYVMFSAAKNTTKHLTRILDVLAAADIDVATSISLQTTDPTTLEAVGRHNISTEAYLTLAADLRRRGHALVGDLILGLPGQTYRSYKADLQFMLDHEIMPRTFALRRLPNAPMNAPEYRSQHRIQIDEHQVVVATASMPLAARERGLKLRNIEAILERYGVLRHVMRFLQWDRDLPATDLMDGLLDVALDDADRYPCIAWLVQFFDVFATPACGWAPFYKEVHHLITHRFALPDDSGLHTVMLLQEFLMPTPGRRFPASLELDHDYVAYYASATRELYTSGNCAQPDRPLNEYPPATFTVWGDPLRLCQSGLDFPGDSRHQLLEGDFAIGSLAANELDSSLVRILPAVGTIRSMIDRRLALAGIFTEVVTGQGQQ